MENQQQMLAEDQQARENKPEAKLDLLLLQTDALLEETDGLSKNMEEKHEHAEEYLELYSEAFKNVEPLVIPANLMSSMTN